MTSGIGGAGSCQSTTGMQGWSSTQCPGEKNDPSRLIDGLFAKIDTKKQGYIDKTELKNAFAALGTSNTAAAGSDSDADALFTQLDGDSDGKVTRNELSVGLQSLASQLLSQLHQSGQRPPPPPRGEDPNSRGDQVGAVSQTASLVATSYAQPQDPVGDATSLSVSA